jgi:hypothetical protein
MDRYAVFGHPVRHSLSPRIHAAFAAQTGEALSYEAIEAPLTGFADALRAFVAAGGRGGNVTVPFKEEAFGLADRCDALAQQAQAVNTLRVEEDGSLSGFNTDGIGLLRDLTQNLALELRGRRVLLLGAGGAAAGVIGPLLAAGVAELVLANRTADRAAALAARFAGRREKLLLEPGRSLVGNAGLLLTRVEYLKPGEDKNFAIVDAAMNDLMRPALYEAYHEIVAVDERPTPSKRYDIVGPICETGDFLGFARDLAIGEGDLLALLSAGAYGMSMASNYNSRPRAAEILINGNEIHLIRERETQNSLMAGERLVD